MNTHLSDFGRKFSSVSGIYELMEDLGRALASGGDMVMMGGGNPAHIPGVEAVWRRRLEEILAQPGAMETMLGDYDTSRGRPEFLEALAAYFNRAFGWNIDADNIAVTIGSQAATFLLFNMLAGSDSGVRKKILFPLVPEYIGYASQGVSDGMFTAWKPRIEMLDGHRFKYHIDFREIGDDVAAICLSRPTNPTANVVADDEMQRLVALAGERGVHLIVDNAYGVPFPNAVFKPATPVLGEKIIHTFSLSKLGLPAARTGIVVADKEIIRRLSIMNASLVLSTSAIGQTIVGSLLAGDEIGKLCRDVIQPFYKARSVQTRQWIAECFDDSLDYHVHLCEGAFFLWVWFRGLPVTDREFYERLKARKVLVIPGGYFFEGLDEPWRHKQECIRLTYCANPDAVRRGVEIIADEARRAYVSR
ncbi:MAG TPA: valine--pyruvate transaminase [Chthoniobacteraceae bacterium]|nr:valine--pyruvate transaminase [Chthoniobacteraceae bacterium]